MEGGGWGQEVLVGGSEKKWSRYVTAYPAGTHGKATHAQSDLCQCSRRNLSMRGPAERRSGRGRALILKPVCTTVAATGCNRCLRKKWDRGRGGGWAPTLRVTPRSLLYRRVCQLGRSGIHAFRQEQRGCSVGEGRAGDGEGDACLPACLPGFYANINVHQWANSPCVLGSTYNPSLFVKYQDQ